MKTKQILVLMTAVLLSFYTSAQWVKQKLPATQSSTVHMPFSGASAGKNTLWLETRDVVTDTSRVAPVEYVRSADGGRTYKTGTILPNNDDYWYHLHPYDAKTAYLLVANSDYSGPFAIKRTVDSGISWQNMPFTPPTFPNLIHFFDTNNGVFCGDPDNLGAYFAYTTNGGNTFTRIPQSNYPSTNLNEFFAGGNYKFVGDAVFITSYDTETGLERLWRSADRGRNWIASNWYDPASVFGGNYSFTDGNNGLMIWGMDIGQYAVYTTDGGATWQNSGTLPGYVLGGPIDYVRGTNNIIAIFEDVSRRILFTAATNDLGKTWHSRKDVVPYKLDSIYTQFGLPPFAWTNLEVIDNNTAWAKFSRTELYRYESTTPIISEKPDLDLQLKADNDGLPLYGSVKYTLTVTNRGISPATGVRINWLPPYKRTNNGVGPYAYQAAYADKGRYDSWNGVWTLDKIDAGAIATATFHLFVLNNTQNVTQTAQVAAMNESDLDSSPNNMGATAKEDDEVGFVAHAINSTAEMPNAALKGKLADFSISPNPAKDKINVSINAEIDAHWSIRMLNSIGQTVFARHGQNNRSVEIDARHFKNGLYLVEYQADGERKVEKIMIQH